MPKPGPTDTVPAMLTPGEIVMNREAVALVGGDKLVKANKEGLKMRQGYQNGGVVSGIYRNGNSYSDNLVGGTQLDMAGLPKLSTPSPVFQTDGQNTNNVAKQLMGDNGSQAAIGAAVKPISTGAIQNTGSIGDTQNAYQASPVFADTSKTSLSPNTMPGYADGTLDPKGVKGIFTGLQRAKAEKILPLSNTNDWQGFANGGRVSDFEPTTEELAGQNVRQPLAQSGFQDIAAKPAPKITGGVGGSVGSFTPSAEESAAQAYEPLAKPESATPLKQLATAEKGILGRPAPPINAPFMTPGVQKKSTLELVPKEEPAPFTMRSVDVPKEPGTSLVPAGERVSSGPEVKVKEGFFNEPKPKPDVNFTNRPSDGSTMAKNRQIALVEGEGVNRPVTPEAAPYTPKERVLDPAKMSKEAKAYVNGPAPKPSLMSNLKGIASGAVKGIGAQEAVGAAGNMAYNALPKSMVGNVLNAGRTLLMGDTENAKRQLFGLPAENLPPLSRAVVGALTPESKEVDGVAGATKLEPKPKAEPKKPEPMTGQTLMPNDSTYAGLGGGSYITSKNTDGIKRVNAMVAAGGLSNPEKEARFARDAANTAAQTAKYGDGKPAQPSEIDKLQDIALNGGATGDMTPSQFGAAKRRQAAAKELLGIRAGMIQSQRQADFQNKQLEHSIKAGESTATYNRQKDEADRQLKKQELEQKTSNVVKIVPEPLDPNNPLAGVKGVAHTYNPTTGEEVISPAVKKAQLEPIRQKYMALLNDPTKDAEYKQGLQRHMAQNYPDLLNESEP